MKTLKFIYACMMLSICMAFAACSDDDDNTTNGGASRYVGVWNVVEDTYIYKEDGVTVDQGTDRYEKGERVLNLMEDGKMAVTEDGATYYGIWSSKGNKLYMTTEYGDYADEVEVVDFSTTRMVIEYNATYTEDGIRCEDYEKVTLKK